MLRNSGGKTSLYNIGGIDLAYNQLGIFVIVFILFVSIWYHWLNLVFFSDPGVVDSRDNDFEEVLFYIYKYA